VTWTHEPPKAPGYYWRRVLDVLVGVTPKLKRRDAPPVLVEVIRRFDGDLWMVPLWPSDRHPWSVSDRDPALADDEWAGPIEPPS